MIISEIQGHESHDVFGMYSSSNLLALEKCHYINATLPCLGQAPGRVVGGAVGVKEG
jgi:hypothetical protein